MVHVTRSPNNEWNPHLEELPRNPGEGNIAWGDRAARAMDAYGIDAWTYLVLLGGADTMAFRLRVAQSHLRSDMLPSFWSHALLVLLKDAQSVRAADAVYVPLLQPEDGPFSPAENGVVNRPLEEFDDPERYPNIAVLALPVAQQQIEERLTSFRRSRATLDSLEHVLRWLAFAWGVAKTGNPLHDNFGLPSACMLETLCGAAGFDLTPGLESRASCPEAIWAAFGRWHRYYEATARIPAGRYSIQHLFPILEIGRPIPASQESRDAKTVQVNSPSPTSNDPQAPSLAKTRDSKKRTRRS